MARFLCVTAMQTKEDLKNNLLWATTSNDRIIFMRFYCATSLMSKRTRDNVCPKTSKITSIKTHFSRSRSHLRQFPVSQWNEKVIQHIERNEIWLTSVYSMFDQNKFFEIKFWVRHFIVTKCTRFIISNQTKFCICLTRNQFYVSFWLTNSDLIAAFHLDSQ